MRKSAILTFALSAAFFLAFTATAQPRAATRADLAARADPAAIRADQAARADPAVASACEAEHPANSCRPSCRNA